MEAELKELSSFYIKELSRLKDFLERGETARIWYSQSPYALCGLYFLCHWLRNCQNPVHVVELPRYRIKENTLISYQGWGEVCPEEFALFLSCEKELSFVERRLYTSRWGELVQENAPLRASVNGRLVSAEGDFYDFSYGGRSRTSLKSRRGSSEISWEPIIWGSGIGGTPGGLTL